MAMGGDPAQIDPSGLGRSLEDAMRLLRQATAQGPAHPDGEVPDAESLVGHGVGADGLVEAEVSAFGRLESLVIDPSLMRAGTTAIAQYVIEAVQAAQEDERARRGETLHGAMPDTADLTRQLERVSEDAFRGFNQMIGELDALTRRMDRR